MNTTADDATPKFAAFISYSHADAAIAAWLHRAIEGYRVPGALVGTEGTHGPVPARVGRVFRDEEELGAAADLSPAIGAALADAAALIVVASPRAAQSFWVGKEIAGFKQRHPDRPVLALIADGVPGDPERECFPEPLRFRVDETGAVDRSVAQEPLAPDLQKMDRDVARMKLISGLIGVPFDALVSRERRRTRRRMIIAGAAASVIIAVLATTVLITLQARAQEQAARVAEEVQRERAEASASIARTQRAAAIRSRDIAQAATVRAERERKRAEVERANAIASAAEARRQQAAAEAATAEALGRQAETLASQALAALGRGDGFEARTLIGELDKLPQSARNRPITRLAQQRVGALPAWVSALPNEAAAIDFVENRDGGVAIADNLGRLHIARGGGAWDSYEAPTTPFLIESGTAFARTGEQWALSAPQAPTRWSEVPLLAARRGAGDTLSLFGIDNRLRLVEFSSLAPATLRPTGLTAREGRIFEAAEFFHNTTGTAILQPDGTLALIGADGKPLANEVRDALRFVGCADRVAPAGLLCHANDGSMQLVGWDGSIAPMANSGFDGVRALLPLMNGVALQRTNGSVAILLGSDTDATAASAAATLAPKEAGVWDDLLVDLVWPDPTAMVMLFAPGRIVARDRDGGATYFDIRIPQGIKSARLENNRRELIALTLNGQVYRIDLGAMWFADWLGRTATAVQRADRAGKAGVAMVRALLPEVPLPNGAPYELIWADGYSKLAIERHDGTALLLGDGRAWRLPGNPRRARILAREDGPRTLIFTDREALIFDRGVKGPTRVLQAQTGAIGAQLAVADASDGKNFLIVGRRGSLLILDDHAVTITDPWPFASEPSRFAVDRGNGLLIMVDASGRSQVSNLASGAEILRAFGGPTATDSISFEGDHAVARASGGTPRAIRLPLSGLR